MEKAIADIVFGFFFGLGFVLAGSLLNLIGNLITRGNQPKP